LDFHQITYYTRPSEKTEASWDDVAAEIKNTFDKLGVPEGERKFLAGVGAQYESEMVYHSVQKHLEELGIIFLSSDDGLRQHPDLFRFDFLYGIPFPIKIKALKGDKYLRYVKYPVLFLPLFLPTSEGTMQASLQSSLLHPNAWLLVGVFSILAVVVLSHVLLRLPF
jgi:hypothetical protein